MGFLQNLGGAHLVVIVLIVLLFFGAPKLPALAKSLGQSMKILKKEVTSDESKTPADNTVRDENKSSTADPEASAEEHRAKDPESR